MKKSSQSQKTVYNFLTPVKMKFKNSGKPIDLQTKPQNLYTRIKSFSWFGSPTKPPQQDSLTHHQSNPPGTVSPSSNPLKFIKKLTNQHFLVGNAYRVDVMYLGGIVDDFIDIDFLWSLDFKRGIMNVAVDIKKCILAFLVSGSVQIYQYNLKKSKEKPILFTTISTSGDVRFIQFAKDSYLTLFYQNSIEIFYIDDNFKVAKKKFSKHYNQPMGASIFQVPQAFQGVINIFFTQPKAGTSMFHLWNLQIKLQKQQITMGTYLKIYDISNGLRDKIVLSNYSKEIFCMNLGHEILAVKKGYIIDTVNSNIDNDHTVLRYLGNDRLIHVLTHKVQLYRFSLNMQLNPPRIVLSSMDSIWSKINSQTYGFLEVLEMMNDNIVVFYQINEEKNKSLSGEIMYAINVTKKIKFEDKIKDTLPSPEELQTFKDNPNKKISDEDYQLIEEKVDMAMKMGLTRRQIYLRLWNNSKKCDIVDYQFLLDTMDYNTIRAEIQSKLKKKSMVLRQVIKIEEGCISMLQTKVFSPQVTIQYLKNFLISHFLLRKLKLYQMFSLIEKQQQKLKRSKSLIQQEQKQESQTIMINIKDYMRFAKCELKSLLLELIRDLQVNKKQAVLKIRTLVKLFKFSFRPIYSNLLQEIIQEAGDNLLVLVEQIPEFLPYEHILDEQQDYALYEGIWGNIPPEEWDFNLYVGGISTIDNKEIVEEMKNSVWAKRHFLSLHDLLPYQKTEILQIHQRNKAEQTFYNFIEKIFYCIKQKPVLSSLINFIQTNYQKLPKHIVGQIFIYRALYNFLKAQNALTNRLEKGEFNEFLKLKDYEVFKLIFDLEKRKKNCILKDVKQGIYNSQEYATEGNDLFNLALLNFFSSQLSQISDIKYLLNRLNNQKYEFHFQNQGMYQVIVKGMQAKLYLGSSHDIPIDQVYIYISNIHIDPNSEIKQDLNYIKIINKHAKKLKKVKLNMNLFQIIRQMQKMLRVLVNYEVQQRGIQQLTDSDQILGQSLLILEQVQRIKSDIYYQAQPNKNLVFFIYLTRILQRETFIPQTIQLLHADQILTRYAINQIFIQNAVIYMYKKRFSKQKIYMYNESYIKELLQLLPEGNQTREFISNEVELGITLSGGGYLVQYPIGGANAILSTVELEAAIGQLSAEKIREIDVERIYQISLRIQQISSDGKISSITMYQIYEIVILRLLQCNAIKDSIHYIRKIMQLNPLNPYNFIYPVLLMKKFTCELCDQNRCILLRILTYQYECPEQLVDVAEKLLNTKCTSLEQKIILKGYLKKVEDENSTFDPHNPIFDQDYIQQLASKAQQRRFAQILRKTFQRIVKVKDQFSQKPQYAIIFTILINNPYGIVKYLYCSKYESNFKGIRCFFSYLSKQQVFNKIHLLQLGKRVFKILHQGLSQTAYIEQIIDKYQSIGLSENLQFEKIKPQSNLSIVMSKSVQRFKMKLKEEMGKKKNRNSKLSQTAQQRRSRIRKRLHNQSASNELIPTQYPYEDSDNQLNSGQPKLKPITPNQRTQMDFDPIFQQQLLLARQRKHLGVYLSQQRTNSQKQLFYSKKTQQLQLRNSVAKLKHKKKQLEDQFNLNLSLRRSIKYGIMLSDNNSKRENQEFSRNTLKRVNSINYTDIMSITHVQHKRVQRVQAKSMFLPEIRDDLTEVKQLQEKNEVKIQSPESIELKHEPKCEEQEDNVNTSKEINGQIEQERSHIVQNEGREMNGEESDRRDNEQLGSNFDNVIDQILRNRDGDNFDLTVILQAKMTPQQFKSLITSLYNSPQLTPSQSISIIKELSLHQTPLKIIKQNLQVYMRMQSFQKRFTLDIDLKAMFPIQGVFIECIRIQQLFNYFKENIVEMLRQSNVYKITKVVSLAFKTNDIQQQLNVEFLVKWLKQLQDNPILDVKDLGRQKQKIRAFTEKISIVKLNAKGEQILSSISDSEFRNQLIETIVQAMRKKKNDEMAQAFVNKWMC